MHLRPWSQISRKNFSAALVCGLAFWVAHSVFTPGPPPSKMASFTLVITTSIYQPLYKQYSLLLEQLFCFHLCMHLAPPSIDNSSLSVLLPALMLAFLCLCVCLPVKWHHGWKTGWNRVWLAEWSPLPAHSTLSPHAPRRTQARPSFFEDCMITPLQYKRGITLPPIALFVATSTTQRRQTTPAHYKLIENHGNHFSTTCFICPLKGSLSHWQQASSTHYRWDDWLSRPWNPKDLYCWICKVKELVHHLFFFFFHNLGIAGQGQGVSQIMHPCFEGRLNLS